MTHLISTKSLAAIALTLGVFAAASPAHARSEMIFSVGVQVPGIYVQAAPVYVQPRQIYTPAPGHYGRYDDGRRHDGQHFQPSSSYGDRDRDGIANVYASGGPHNQWRRSRLYGPYGDLDRDGIRNQWDRDVDGDGVRNRFDRVPNHPNRR
jgi:hypothetical protein